MSDAMRGEAFRDMPVMPLREVVMFPRSIRTNRSWKSLKRATCAPWA